jgi:hypothetical protein
MVIKSGFALTLLFGTSLALQGCGNTTGDRALSGGLIGAGSGAAIGAAAGGGPGAALGAAVGGVGGAAAGALTSPEDVNLGRPVWRR